MNVDSTLWTALNLEGLPCRGFAPSTSFSLWQLAAEQTTTNLHKMFVASSTARTALRRHTPCHSTRLKRSRTLGEEWLLVLQPRCRRQQKEVSSRNQAHPSSAGSCTLTVQVLTPLQQDMPSERMSALMHIELIIMILLKDTHKCTKT